MEFVVKHVDCNGKPIPDISKVVLPLDLSIELLNMRREWSDIPRKETGDLLPLETDFPLDKENKE